MAEIKRKSDHTRCVSPDRATSYDGAIVTPIFQTANYRFADSQQLIDLQEGRAKAYLYARYTNPTVEEVEHRLADLEHGEKALLFASGMAATASICLTFLHAGDRLLASEALYGGTATLFDDILARFAVTVDRISVEEFPRLPDYLTGKTRLLWFETPTNPTLQVLDLERIVAAAKQKGVLTVCDNTFATPINQKPLEWGVDLVMHSASKFLNGHSDLVGGFAVGAAEKIEQVYLTRKFLGGVADPHAAFLIGRGLKTLAVRMERHNSSAQQIADYLSRHPQVKRVCYPGLPGTTGHEIAVKQMGGFGGMVTFEVGGGLNGAIKLIDSFKLIANATSLGGVESLACLPPLTSQYGIPAEARQKAGVTDGMIRLSVGLEDVDDLKNDLDQALEAK